MTAPTAQRHEKGERPIPFSAPMIAAYREDRKRQTRRIVVPGPRQCWLQREVLDKSPRAYPCLIEGEQWAQFIHPLAGQTVCGVSNADDSPLTCIKCPYGSPGDTLWFREAYRTLAMWDALKPSELPSDPPLRYEADAWINKPTEYPYGRYRNARFMMRAFARLSTVITGVRIERLQDISEEDARAEGCEPWPFCAEQAMTSGELGITNPYRGGYAVLWDEINDERATWKSNPWVWVIEFSRYWAGKGER